MSTSVRETAETKATRLLTEGRVTIYRVDDDEIRATVIGDNARYDTGFHVAAGRWNCTCPAYGNCSHIAAVRRVTVAVAPWPDEQDS